MLPDCQSCNIAHHSALVRGVCDVCSSGHAILPSLCLSRVMAMLPLSEEILHITLPHTQMWVMCVPLSVMQYCHHSALVQR